jgi:vacuolar-type H+-ATPase subunit E/Vma4
MAYIAQHTVMLDANTRGLDDEGEAAQGALDALNALSGQTNATQEDQRQLAAATGEAADVTTEASQEAQQALDDWLKKLQGLAAGFVDPAGTYRDLVQEMAQNTADSTSDASDSWSDYVGDVDVSLDELAARLQEQLDNQANWRDNLAQIAQWAGEDVANALAQMGEDGVDLVAQMADGTTAGAQDMREQILRQIQQGGEEWTADLDNSMKVMAAIGTDGAKKTVQGLASELNIGADEVRRSQTATA